MKNQTTILPGVPEPVSRTADTPSPFVIEFFTVQSLGVQCMAYRDRLGKWRSAFANVELPGVVRVLD